jgi:hypothetical protein
VFAAFGHNTNVTLDDGNQQGSSRFYMDWTDNPAAHFFYDVFHWGEGRYAWEQGGFGPVRCVRNP